jgi:hypothetical protein
MGPSHETVYFTKLRATWKIQDGPLGCPSDLQAAHETCARSTVLLPGVHSPRVACTLY